MTEAFSPDRPLYDLLPTVYQLRDADRGYPLRELLSVVEDEYRRVRDDINGLYDNWFIETCDEWVVPYLGDLLGVDGLAPVPEVVASMRALVANTISYRRRKGTAAMLEQLARDVTGWPARAVEYFTLLGTTQNLNHVRPQNVLTPDLRNPDALELLNTPFDTTSHTVDVRHIDNGRGRHNIANLGLHLWRLAAYALTEADARAVDAAHTRWTFDPAGRDLPLFNRPRTEQEVTHLAEEVNVPGRLRRRRIYAELEAIAAGTGSPIFFAEPDAVLRVRLDGAPTPVAVSRLQCCDLTDWQRPAGGPDDIAVAVDPALGRLTLPVGVEPGSVQVDFAYGFPGNVGAGPYDRRAILQTSLGLAGNPWPTEVHWQVGVSRRQPAEPHAVFATLTEAVDAWNARPDPSPGQVGVIAIMDSATYAEDLTGPHRVRILPGSRLLIVAASWPQRDDPDHPGVPFRDPGVFVASGVRPHLLGRVEVEAAAGAAAGTSELLLDGLSLEGDITVRPGDLASLVISDCTLVGHRDPALPGVGSVIGTGNAHLSVRMVRTSCAFVELTGIPGLGLTDCIVHADGDQNAVCVDADIAHAEVDACTLLGRMSARSLAGSNSIFRGRVHIERRQLGCVRFSYVPPTSRVPRRYRCQPENATSTVTPQFTSIEPGDPAFCQLGPGCPTEIATGADNEEEMGVYNFLSAQRRLENLVSSLDHYVRFGLEAGVFFET